MQHTDWLHTHSCAKDFKEEVGCEAGLERREKQKHSKRCSGSEIQGQQRKKKNLKETFGRQKVLVE